MITQRAKAAIGGAVIGLALLALTAGPAFAQPSPPTPPPAASATSGAPMARAHMEQMIDRCVTMMNSMSSMPNMMNGTSRMPGMMGGQNGHSPPNAGGR